MKGLDPDKIELPLSVLLVLLPAAHGSLEIPLGSIFTRLGLLGVCVSTLEVVNVLLVSRLTRSRRTCLIGSLSIRRGPTESMALIAFAYQLDHPFQGGSG